MEPSAPNERPTDGGKDERDETLQSIDLGLLRPLRSKSTGETLPNSESSTGHDRCMPGGMDEHQDDLEPEVEEGAEFETETYSPEAFVTDEPEHEGQATAQLNRNPNTRCQQSERHVGCVSQRPVGIRNRTGHGRVER